MHRFAPTASVPGAAIMLRIALEVRLVGVGECADAGQIFWMMDFRYTKGRGCLYNQRPFRRSETDHETATRRINGAHKDFQIYDPAVTKTRCLRSHNRPVVSCTLSSSSIITGEAVLLCAEHFHSPQDISQPATSRRKIVGEYRFLIGTLCAYRDCASKQMNSLP
jgi:hypothetical protein